MDKRKLEKIKENSKQGKEIVEMALTFNVLKNSQKQYVATLMEGMLIGNELSKLN